MSERPSMKAVAKLGSARDLTQIVEVPVPEALPGTVVIQVEACGLCGSDLHAWNSDDGYEWVVPPVIYGHEFIGTIASLGDGVTDWHEGDRVAVISIQGCLNCDNCRKGRTQRCPDRKVIGLSYDGGMAEFVRVPVRYLIPLPPDLPAVQAVTIEPLSVAWHALFAAGQLESGMQVIVSGAGFVGIACAAIAQASGADVTLIGTEKDEGVRLPAASAIGLATRVSGRGLLPYEPDLWVEASGAHQALSFALSHTKRGGTVSAVGMYDKPPQESLSQLVRRELTLQGSYASTSTDYERVIAMLVNDEVRVGSLIKQFNLSQALDAFEAAYKATVIKPVIVPN